jgi:WD40 repeat protein
MTEAEGFFGTFSVFDLSTLEKIKEEKMELKSSLIRMLVCRKSSRIFIVLRGSILTYNYQAEVKDDKYNKLQKGKNWLKCESEIKTAVINNSETFLAVLVAAGTLQNAKIEIYNLGVQEGQFYALYRVEEYLQPSIDVIDFCTDHEYLVYQGADEEQTIIDLMTKEKIKAVTLENPPVWNEEAKRTAPNIKEIATYYSEENKLLRVVQVMNEGVIATDEMGSVRVFPYPLAANRNYKVHIDHLNHIYLCVLSPDYHTLVTVSREDRAIHLWEVIHSSDPPPIPNEYSL